MSDDRVGVARLRSMSRSTQMYYVLLYSLVLGDVVLDPVCLCVYYRDR